MKKALCLLALIPCFMSCSEPGKALDKTTLDLEHFDFSTPITTLLPESTRDTGNKNWYRIKSTVLSADTTYEDAFETSGKALWVEYREQQFTYDDALAKFGAQNFNTVNIVTTLQGNIMLLNGVAGRVSPSASKAFVAALDKKYGAAVKTQGEFIHAFTIYTWTLEDRMIKYVPLSDDEKGTLHIGAGKEAGASDPHYRALFYVIKKEYAAQLTGNLHSGDLLHCD